MADQAWRTFCAWPLWAQILGWLFLFWMLVPILVWRTSLSTPWKVIATLAILFVLVSVAADEPPPSRSTTARQDTGDAQDEGERIGRSSPEKTEEQTEDRAAKPGHDEEKAENKGSSPARRSTTLVVRVVDGDTIEVHAGEGLLDVRLIGVDTPETVHPSEPVGCFGSKASDFTKSQLEGKRVRLEFDVETKDRYGRTLAYVWLADQMFNQTLIARGYGQVATYPPNVKYVDLFTAAQRSARNNNRGLWRACRGGGGKSGGSKPADAAGGSKGNCDPNYQGACIPSYPPDLDCGDVSAARFHSTGNDPHGFDGDGDGIACE